LGQNPHNYIFLLLKAFSILILEKENDDFIEDAQRDIFEGFYQMSKEYGGDIPVVEERFRFYKNKLLEFDKNIQIDEIGDVLSHKLHTEWVKNFNNKFNNKKYE
jgi:hypothetical protein